MRLHLWSLIALILLTGCGASPDAKLAPKLSHYATAQQQCNAFIEVKSELTGKVEKECALFLKRLDKNSEIANDLASGKLKKVKPKRPKYSILVNETD